MSLLLQAQRAAPQTPPHQAQIPPYPSGFSTPNPQIPSPKVSKANFPPGIHCQEGTGQQRAPHTSIPLGIAVGNKQCVPPGNAGSKQCVPPAVRTTQPVESTWRSETHLKLRVQPPLLREQSRTGPKEESKSLMVSK